MKDRLKRGAAWLTTAVTLVSSVFAAVPAVSAATFNDVNGSTSYYQGIMWAYDHGILQGYGNGNFGPDNCVRRSEFAKMIVNYTHTGTGLVGSQGSDPGFSDVSSAAWYYPFVKEAKYKNYLQGYPDGTFRPNICVNRAEAMKIAAFSLLPNVGMDSSGNPVMYDNKLVTDVEIFSWYAPYARLMFKNRLMGTDHTEYDTAASSAANVYAIKFFPGGSMTRKEVAEMLYRTSTFMGSTPTPAPSPVPAAGKPVLTLPANGLQLDPTTTGVNFQFLPTTGVSSYQLALKMPGNNDFGWWDITNTTLNGNGYVAYFFSKGTSGFLNTDGVYTWKIRAWNSDRTSYTDSDVWTMYSYLVPTNVNITYQAPTANYTSMPSQITFQWSANVTDSTLVLEYRDPNNISTVTKTSKFTSASGYSKTLYLNDYQTDFTNYKTFCWKLEKTGTNYLSSTYGYPCVSYVPVTLSSAPTLISPAVETVFHGSQTINFYWTPVTGATYYRIQIRNSASSSYYFDQTTTNTSYGSYQNAPGATSSYYWRVVAYDASGNSLASAERLYLVSPN